MAILVENYSDVQSAQLVKDINECIAGLLAEMHDSNILIHVKNRVKFPDTQAVCDHMEELFTDFFEGEEVDYDIDTAVDNENDIIRLHPASDRLYGLIMEGIAGGSKLLIALNDWLNSFDEIDGDEATFTLDELGLDPTLSVETLEATVYNTVRDILRSQKAWCINVWKGWGCQCGTEVDAQAGTIKVSLWYNV